MQFLFDHYEEILALLGTLYMLISGIVALTPSKGDDKMLARFMQRVSFLAPRNVGGFSLPGRMPRRDEDSVGPMLVVLLCLAPLMGGCAKKATLDAVIDFVRASSCAVCDKLGGNECPEHEEP